MEHFFTLAVLFFEYNSIFVQSLRLKVHLKKKAYKTSITPSTLTIPPPLICLQVMFTLLLGCTSTLDVKSMNVQKKCVS